jgi:hypothetical protein
MKYRIILALSLLTALSSSAVLASGSVGGSAPRGSAKNSEYAMGKKIYMKKVACDSCMMKGGVSDSEGAKQLMMKLDSDVEGLTASERMQVQAYLKRRFKVM